MFKKPHTTKPSNQLSNSACKKLVSQVSTGLEQERLKGEKRISVARAYTHTGQEQQLTIYYDSDGEPIYFQMTTPHYLVPSIYTLIRFPTLLPTIITNHHVLDKLLHGADLMLPGLHKPDLLPLVHLVQNELVSIRGHLPDDPIWAVGYLAQDVSLLLKAESGKAVITLHTQNDFLWNTGSKRIPTPVENPQPPPESLDVALVEDEARAQPLDTPAPPIAEKPPPDQVDEYLLSALLMTLWKGDKLAGQFPMPASLFYSAHILPARPAGCPRAAGVKDSSAKTLAKWLKAHQKKDFLQVKEDRKGGETLITSLNLSHPELHKFDKFRTIAEQDKLDAAALQSAELAGAAPDAKNPQAAFSASWNLPETRISALFRARKDPRVRAWIAGTEIEPEGLHSRQQIEDALGKYLDGQVARASASAKPVNRGVVVPDASLAAVLARDGSSAAISRSEVLEMLLASAFEPWWRLERDGVLVTEKQGETPTIVLKKKKRAGPKHATLIAGLELFGIEPGRLAKELRTMCAGSTTTHPVPPDHPAAKALASKDILAKLTARFSTEHAARSIAALVEVECQGDQRAFVQNLLLHSFAVPKSSVTVL
ncbi:hypothetical protein PCASD_03317 [Puccinia coronata f. sp. avenae]|uniref:SUI1 domain-containing protein n=1 Tax=Puccinia coronata f. sp. avenae TaxID=200324 RepID=A0A2N5VDX4_9BASI|nr:hypothetical protein PCASD_03317 [Puccinia coronata f. sp. avenae]